MIFSQKFLQTKIGRKVLLQLESLKEGYRIFTCN